MDLNTVINFIQFLIAVAVVPLIKITISTQTDLIRLNEVINMLRDEIKEIKETLKNIKKGV
ncbi:MAG: hypothetical protein ACPL1F_02920 [bacterium]